MQPTHDLRSGHESPFFRGWARFVIRYRWLCLLGTFLTTAAMVQQIRTKMHVDNSVEAFLSRDSPAARALEDSRDAFGRDDLFLVMAKGDVFSLPYLEKLKKLHDELENLDLPLATLGQRKEDRDSERAALRKDGGADAAAGGAATNPTEELGNEDPFAGFGDDEGWGDEGGGGLMDEVLSLINVRSTRSTGDGGIEVGELMDPFPSAEEIPAIKQEVLGDATLVGQVVDPTGNYSVIALRTQFMSEADSTTLYRKIREIGDAHSSEGFFVRVAGLPALAADLNALMLHDLGTMAILATFMMVLILAFIFRHPFGVFGPILVVIMAIAWSIGLMSFFGMPMTMMTNILPAFVLCVGLGDAVHLLSIYRDQRRDGVENHEALMTAVAITGKPILFTTLTTMFGLLSFRFASVKAIQDLGTAGAFGVSIALVHTLIFLVALISFNTKSKLGVRTQSERDPLNRFLNFCASLSGPGMDMQGNPSGFDRRRRLTLLGGALIALVALGGASRLRVWHNPLSWIPPTKYIRMAFDEIDANLGGAGAVQILIEGKGERGVKDLEIIQGMDQFITYIRAYRDPKTGMAVVGNSISILDPIRETHRALHGGGDAAYRLPDTQQGLTDSFTLFENAAPDALRRMITVNGKLTVITLRTRWLEATSYGPLTVHIAEGATRFLPAHLVTVRPTGSVYNVFSTVSMLLRDLLRSFAAAFVVITFLMMVMLRSTKLGLVAMIPNLLPILLIMGLMGYAGVPIDMANLLIGSIALGVAVDDTIHFLHHFKVHFAIEQDVDKAIANALKESGRAMAATSTILCTGFFVYLGATMFSIQRFGVLIGTTVVFALLIDLIGCPALLRTIYKSKATLSSTQV